MHLAAGSDLIDAGVDLGLPFKGKAPDLGAFESDFDTSVMENDFLPADFGLQQNYPNPFNPRTMIEFHLSRSGRVKLTVYNANGQLMATLLDRNLAKGSHTVAFEAGNLASGVYFYKIETSNFVQTKKMLLMR